MESKTEESVLFMIRRVRAIYDELVTANSYLRIVWPFPGE